MLTFVIVFLALLIILFLLYLLFLVRPATGKADREALFTEYAHRGLYGEGIAENSLAAFERAVSRGYGIELDVQLSSDGRVMVFHDYTLERMTGRAEKLSALTAEKLGELSLAGTDQTIPTLEQVLALVDGRVPILVELKGEDLDSALCGKTAELLSGYSGEYCIESFNPFLIRGIRKYLRGAFCGLLYTNVCRDKKKISALNILLSSMAFNFIARPDFIAYNKEDRGSLPVKLTTALYRAPRFVWTVKGERELALAKERGECPIFERIAECGEK